MEPDGTGAHMSGAEIAAYVDGDLAPEQRARLDAHLADCADCRDELVHVWRIVRGSSSTRPVRTQLRRGVLKSLAVAAGIVLLLVALPQVSERSSHRDTLAADAPVLRAPRGDVRGLPSFSWSAVAGADLYRVVLFDGGGHVLWEGESADTVVVLPDGVQLGAGETYFWKVEARTDWDRWRSSELVEFTMLRSPDR